MSKTLGQVGWEAKIAFYKVKGYHLDFTGTWEDLSPDQRGAQEAAALAVRDHLIEGIAGMIDRAAEEADKLPASNPEEGIEAAARARVLEGTALVVRAVGRKTA